MDSMGTARVPTFKRSNVTRLLPGSLLSKRQMKMRRCDLRRAYWPHSAGLDCHARRGRDHPCASFSCPERLRKSVEASRMAMLREVQGVPEALLEIWIEVQTQSELFPSPLSPPLPLESGPRLFDSTCAVLRKTVSPIQCTPS